MARNEFETETGILLARHFPVVHRIADAAFNRNLGRQVVKKPFDYFGITQKGAPFAAEAKRVRAHRFSFKALVEHQYEALGDFSCAGGLSLMFINFRVKRPGQRCGRAFCMPFQAYQELVRSRADVGRKSMRPEHIPTQYELARISGGWDVTDGDRGLETFIVPV